MEALSCPIEPLGVPGYSDSTLASGTLEVGCAALIKETICDPV